MGFRHRSIRSIITRRASVLLVLLLVAGAIVNVAVAWGLAMFNEVPSLAMLPLPNRSDSSHWWDSHPRGGTRVLAAWRLSTDGFERRDMLGCEPSAATIEIDSVSTTIQSRRDTTFELSTAISAGWPWQCLRGEQWADDVSALAAICGLNSDSSNRGRSIGAYEIEPPWRRGNGDFRLLPLQPIWPGFAINTLLYAAILWLLFAAPFALRRRSRIKRGLCPACAYPVGKSDVCTECGTPVKSKEIHTES